MRQWVLWIFLLTATAANAEPELVFVRNENMAMQSVAEVIFRQAMSRLEVALTVREAPPARARMLNLQGVVAGEVARIESYGEANPALIRVVPSYYEFISMAYARKTQDISITNQQSLSPYRIAHLRGSQHSADILKGLDYIEANSIESLFSMLASGRIDVIIMNELDGRIAINQMGLSDSIKPVGELARFALHVYLNPAHQQWQQPISEALQGMRDSGELATITSEAEQQAISRHESLARD